MDSGTGPTRGEGSLLPYGLLIGGAIVAGAVLLVLGVRSLGRSAVPGLSGARTGAVHGAGGRAAVPRFALHRVGVEEMATPDSLRGQVVVLHFWATWCAPCRAEFPEFAKYAETVDRKGGVRTLAVSLDDQEEVAMVWALRNGGGIAVWHDSKELAGALGVEAIPTTVLLDKEGRIAYREAGVQNWTASGVPKRVEELRGE